MSDMASLGPLMQILQQIMGGQQAGAGQPLGQGGGQGSGMNSLMQLFQLLSGGMNWGTGQNSSPGAGGGAGSLQGLLGLPQLKTGPGQTNLGNPLGTGTGTNQPLYAGGLSSILGAAPETLSSQVAAPITPGGVIPTVNGPNNPVQQWQNFTQGAGQSYIGG